MSEPSLTLTFEDLIVRVAELLAMANKSSGAAKVPSDPYELDVCKRMVNDGWRRFYNANPTWNWTNRIFTITLDTEATSDRVVNGESWRYYMPDGFYGHVIGELTYPENTGFAPLEEVDEGTIRNQRSLVETAGYPSIYNIRALHDDPKARWELVLWPDPTQDLVITGRCRLYANKLVELSDTPCAGVQFDQAIEAACLAEAELKREDSVGIYSERFSAALTDAIRLDQQTAPRHLGDYGGKKLHRGRIYTGADTYTNRDGTEHTFVLP